MASPESGQENEPSDGERDGGKYMAVAAVAVLAVAVVVGVLAVRSQQDVRSTAADTTVSPSAQPVVRTEGVPGAGKPHQEGDDCSHDYIAARWQQRDGRWVCAPPGIMSSVHRAGEDCSHDGLVAQWVVGPGPAWLCQTQRRMTTEAPPPLPAPVVPTRPHTVQQAPVRVPPSEPAPAPVITQPPAPRAVPAPAPAPAPPPAPAPAPAPAPVLPQLPQLPIQLPPMPFPLPPH
ncbi:hypothetical protein [Nocardia vaccinii]|uniref:hypothetical protein n=1 Tax=Nocardia vaccinii TaxID=1822 RepID=UPI00082B1F4B|nr:hypothetical protein [Nocardia vaccinii]